MLNRLWKPWFIYRPTQVVQRAYCEWERPIDGGYHPLPVAWGLEVIADPGKTIGHSIWTTGIYDLAVSEVITRLVQSGDTVIDAGANVGYMTLLASVAATPGGRVIGFEPHPDLYRIAVDNAEASGRRFTLAAVEIRNQALGEAVGSANLVVPAGFEQNDGLATLAAQDSDDQRSIPVEVTTLDAVVGTQAISMLKLDVEGHELAVLRGGRHALAAGRIGNIVFENRDGNDSNAARFLQSHGYTLYSIGWTMRGLMLMPMDSGTQAICSEGTSCLATLQPEHARVRCGEKGWRALSRRLLRQRVRLAAGR